MGFTRAKTMLILSLARERRTWGEVKPQMPSRFLDDIPLECLAQPVRPRQAAYMAGDRGVIGPPRERRMRRGPPRDELDQRGGWDDEPVYDLDADTRDSPVGFEPGATVNHVALGAGTVVGSTGSGKTRLWIVEFSSVGRKTVQAKWLSLA